MGVLDRLPEERARAIATPDVQRLEVVERAADDLPARLRFQGQLAPGTERESPVALELDREDGEGGQNGTASSISVLVMLTGDGEPQAAELADRQHHVLLGMIESHTPRLRRRDGSEPQLGNLLNLLRLGPLLARLLRIGGESRLVLGFVDHDLLRLLDEGVRLRRTGAIHESQGGDT